MEQLILDHYCTYDELTDFVKSAANSYPGLVTLDSMGKSWQGRDVWMLTITNRDTGMPQDKPAMYIDGNIHAGEVTGSMVCLYTIQHLLSQYGSDEEVTWLLDNRTFYIAPRVNPDGAELYLTTPYMLRSSVRPYPDPQVEELPGLHPVDVDGDGWILHMRQQDDQRGEWKVSPRDPRLLVARRPDDREGPFYRVFQEGFISDYEGKPFDVHSVPWTLDMNRNFPSNWSAELRGGGPYPASEPEVRNIVEFILAHTNIGALQAFHTTGGIIFRGPYVYPEEKMDRQDFHALISIAQRGTELTGYPDVCSYSGPFAATIVDWAYEHRGILGFTTELWDMYGRAGVERPDYSSSHRPRVPADVEAQGLKLLEWNDRELAGEGFFNWRPFDHPQLGPVELGGWNPKFVRQNPPPKFLEPECHKNMLFTFKHAAALPDVRIGKAHATAVDEDLYRVTVVVENIGYLPTYLTNRGRQVGAVHEDRVTLEVPENDGIRVEGRAEQAIGYLDGFLNGQLGGAWRFPEPARSARRVSWLVNAPGDTKVTIRVRSEKGGTDCKTLSL